MTMLDVAATLVCLTAAFGVLNHFLLRLPSTIGLVVIGLAASLGLIGIDAVIPGFDLDDIVRRQVLGIDLAGALLDGMLGFLLFAGALHLEFEALRNQIAALADRDLCHRDLLHRRAEAGDGAGGAPVRAADGRVSPKCRP